MSAYFLPISTSYVPYWNVAGSKLNVLKTRTHIYDSVPSKYMCWTRICLLCSTLVLSGNSLIHLDFIAVFYRGISPIGTPYKWKLAVVFWPYGDFTFFLNYTDFNILKNIISKSSKLLRKESTYYLVLHLFGTASDELYSCRAFN